MATPAVAWFEVTGKDGAALQEFYGKLFDWQIQHAGDDSGYGLVAAADKGIGGGIGPAQDGGQGQVTFYVEVDDPAAYLQKAEALGGHDSTRSANALMPAGQPPGEPTASRIVSQPGP